ncbi:MAG TPA: NnrS family protein [Dehalococcoidia bacterium]|nr:NnrS family protein [Dehalococcoidia bacterium]
MRAGRLPGATDGTIPLTPVAMDGRADNVYKSYIVCSLLLAVLVGFVLGIHVPLSQLLDAGRPERTADLVHAHGQVQLLGFAGLYVMGMSYRLIPRFSSSRIDLLWMVQPTLWLMVLGLLTKSMLLPLLDGDLHDAVLIGSTLCLLLASACFLLITASTLVMARRADVSAYPFLLGALLLFVAMEVSFLAVVLAVKDGMRNPPYLAVGAMLQLELTGFLISFVLAVSSRALPAMTGHERPEASIRRTALALTIAVLLLAGCLLCLEYVSYRAWVARLSDLSMVAIGAVLLHIVWIAGVLRPAANRVSPASRPHLWLVRSAFMWLACGGILAIYAGVSALAKDEIVTPPQFDALRHLLAVGVVTILIVGMSLMILPEFAGQRLSANRQKWLAILLSILLNGAVVLRVLPSLAGTGWSLDTRDALLATAGGLAELAMLVFSLSLLRLLARSARARV